MINYEDIIEILIDLPLGHCITPDTIAFTYDGEIYNNALDCFARTLANKINERVEHQLVHARACTEMLLEDEMELWPHHSFFWMFPREEGGFISKEVTSEEYAKLRLAEIRKNVEDTEYLPIGDWK